MQLYWSSLLLSLLFALLQTSICCDYSKPQPELSAEFPQLRVQGSNYENCLLVSICFCNCAFLFYNYFSRLLRNYYITLCSASYSLSFSYFCFSRRVFSLSKRLLWDCSIFSSLSFIFSSFCQMMRMRFCNFFCSKWKRLEIRVLMSSIADLFVQIFFQKLLKVVIMTDYCFFSIAVLYDSFSSIFQSFIMFSADFTAFKEWGSLPLAIFYRCVISFWFIYSIWQSTRDSYGLPFILLLEYRLAL